MSSPPAKLGPVQRTVKIAFADLQKHRKRWQDIVDDGTTVANALANSVLTARSKEQKESLEDFIESLDDGEVEDESKAKIESLKAELGDVIVKLETTLKKLQTIHLSLLSLYDETANNLGEEYIYTIPLFLTCPLETFGTPTPPQLLPANIQYPNTSKIAPVYQSKRILDMHVKEMALKRAIASGIPQIRNRKDAMLHISAWLQQPYLEEEVLEEVDELWSVETGAGE
ncbi:hypothetical protein HK097_007840 [Rhizophlyctis rosea]|uniref:Uncharacterized protein n=1 Tax=Rhizophlyctis rosea TaxID=64517 RepID=A0AAD5SD38_9FUNG|nr:hypothetical protein HK097_007840 [Rhizophlyctis rosea]